MSLKDKLFKMFVYTGAPVKDEATTEYSVEHKEVKDTSVTTKTSSKSTTSTTKSPERVVPNLKKVFSNVSKLSSNKQVISNYTNGLIYESIHNVVKECIPNCIPIEEFNLLLKRFLEEKVVDSSMYTPNDLLHINSVVKYLTQIKNTKVSSEDTYDSVCTKIFEHAYYLNILELLDIHYGYSIMDSAVFKSYAIVSFKYNSSYTVSVPEKINLPSYNLNINDSVFTILNEIKSIISNVNTLEERINYIRLKTGPYLVKYVEDNKIPIQTLLKALAIFDSLTGTVHTISDGIVIQSEPVVTSPSINIPSDNPIERLRKTSEFIDRYASLVDVYNNSNVTSGMLKEAVDEIDKSITFEGVILDEDESLLYRKIKLAYSCVSDDWGVTSDD